MTAEIIPLFDTEQASEVLNKKEYIGKPDRIKTIKEELGFYPHSNDEASRVMGLLGRSEQAYPALSYLNEIAVHQRKFSTNIPGALRAVVHKFDEYAGNALNEVSYMDTFIHQFKERSPNNFASFSTILPLPEWQHDSGVKAALTAIARHIETREFAENEGNDSLGKRDLIDYTLGEDREARIISTLSKTRAGNLIRTAEAVRSSQENRFAFWMEQLDVSRRHLFARETATIALRSLTEAQHS